MSVFCQAAVGFGGGEEGLVGGEGFVIGAAGDDALGTAEVFGVAAAIPLGTEVDEGPAGHVVGILATHQGQTAVDGLKVSGFQIGFANPHHRAFVLDMLPEGVESQAVATRQVGSGQ